MWLLVIALALWPAPLLAAPFVPANDAEILERLPRSASSQARDLRRRREALAQDPENLVLAVQLAGRYREIGRAEADPRYYGYAQAALRAWWDLEKPPAEVLVMRAMLRQARHDFDGALNDLSLVLTVQPANVQARLLRSVNLQLRGDYAGAGRDCYLLHRLTSRLVATTCTSRVAGLTGQAENGYSRLYQALAHSPSADGKIRLWAMTVLAEIAARLGRDEDAERLFKQAQSLGIRDTYLLETYADYLLDQDRPREVSTLLNDDTRSDGLLLRLALAEKQQRAPQLDRYVEGLRARFAANRLRGANVHLRNEIRFTLHFLNDPHKALQLAAANWESQREPWDARLFLEAALMAGERAAAEPVLNWLESSKLEDVHLRRLVLQLQ